MDRTEDNSPEENVFDLASFKAKKEIKDELAHGRQPLFISHLDGKLKGSPHLKSPAEGDFGDRLSRIKNSLEKINRLMSELKKVSKDEDKKTSSSISILSRH